MRTKDLDLKPFGFILAIYIVSPRDNGDSGYISYSVNEDMPSDVS